jgi:dynein heavy chain 1, cytosolic
MFAFQRFYFVNNDDLIEIIGNSIEPMKIMVHLGKMFAAINGLQTNFDKVDDPNNLSGSAMLSREGEVVVLNKAVVLAVGVKDWLASLHSEMSETLATLLQAAATQLMMIDGNGESKVDNTTAGVTLLKWMNAFPAQVVVLAAQLLWTNFCEEAFRPASAGKESLTRVLQGLDGRLQTLSLSVLQEMDPDLRRKCEHVLTEMVHQRDVLRLLVSLSVKSNSDFNWLYHLRFYWNPIETNLMQRLSIKMSNASFHYGFEYLGVGERLVQTPLTDRCYLTLTQALHFRMGANPFGPAGTGKVSIHNGT